MFLQLDSVSMVTKFCGFLPCVVLKQNDMKVENFTVFKNILSFTRVVGSNSDRDHVI